MIVATRILFCLSLFVLFAASLVAEDSPPNILIITADNLGYGDLKSYNPQSPIVTPYLDKLAEQSARLTSFYTASPTCTVSRASLLTGRIPQRHKLTRQLPGLAGNYGIGLKQDETLISQLLRDAPKPYRTGCFGKWNIGFAPGSRPTERGFDEFLGHASGNIDYYHHLYNGKHDLFKGTEEFHADGAYATDLFADAAISFIKNSSKEKNPWFCYLPFNAPHFPNKKNKQPGQKFEWQAPARAFAPYHFGPDESDPLKRYYAVVTALDEAIGRVLNALDSIGIADETFVFFFSDNGAFRLNRRGLDVGSNLPLRSGGVTCWEGGLRVTAFARWPGKIKQNSVLDEPLWSPDLLIACARLANAPLPQDIVFDGKDPLPVLLDKAKSEHQSFYFDYQSHSALRMGKWKIVREEPSKEWQLFNLNQDVQESNNLADSHPEIVESLIRERQRWQQTFPQ